MNDRAAEVQACLEPRADEMAGLLEELIARDTENPPGRRLSECGRLLSDAMARLGFAPELLEVPPIASLKDPCIVRGMAGDGTRKIPGGGGAIEHADQAALHVGGPAAADLAVPPLRTELRQILRRHNIEVPVEIDGYEDLRRDPTTLLHLAGSPPGPPGSGAPARVCAGVSLASIDAASRI